MFRAEKDHNYLDALFQIYVTEDKGQKTLLMKESVAKLKRGNYICMPISVYLRSNKYR
jgi:hypothetical protein